MIPVSQISAIRPSMMTLVSSTSGFGSLDLLGELDVGDDEAELVLGLQQRRDGEVAGDQRDEQMDQILAASRSSSVGRRCSDIRDDRLQGLPEEGGQSKKAQQQAEDRWPRCVVICLLRVTGVAP